MDALRDVWIGLWTTCGQQKHADHKVDHKPIHTQPPLAHTTPRGKISELRMPAAQQQNDQCLIEWVVISYSERMIYTARSHKPRSHYERDGPLVQTHSCIGIYCAIAATAPNHCESISAFDISIGDILRAAAALCTRHQAAAQSDINAYLPL